MKIIVVYNRVKSVSSGNEDDRLADEDNVKIARDVGETLSSLGHQISYFEIDKNNADSLVNLKVDLFFNLAEGLGDIPESAHLATKLIEKTGKPTTGTSSDVILATTDKIATKKRFQKAKIPTPEFWISSKSLDLKKINFPIIVKPSRQDSSLGITEQSVFANSKGLQEHIKKIDLLYKDPILIEKFLPGREFRIAIIGNESESRCLPISELVYGKSFANKFKVFDFSAKWIENSIGFKDTFAISPPQNLSARLQNKINQVALATYLVMGCNGYARVDIRLDEKDIPTVLEINANPAIGKADAVVTSARAAGISYEQLLQEIINCAFTKDKGSH